MHFLCIVIETLKLNACLEADKTLEAIWNCIISYATTGLIAFY